MKAITTRQELAEAIRQLELKQKSDISQLKDEFTHAWAALNPVTLIKKELMGLITWSGPRHIAAELVSGFVQNLLGKNRPEVTRPLSLKGIFGQVLGAAVTAAISKFSGAGLNGSSNSSRRGTAE
jgi:hypothetical protein